MITITHLAVSTTTLAGVAEAVQEVEAQKGIVNKMVLNKAPESPEGELEVELYMSFSSARNYFAYMTLIELVSPEEAWEIIDELIAKEK